MERRTFLFGLLGAVGLAAGGGVWFTSQPKFGRLPSGARLARIQASPHFVNGKFQCLEPVEVMAKNESRLAATIKFLTRDSKGLTPEQPMLSKKTEIASLSRDEDVLVWLGHSSYYMQLGGQRVLIDPVFSDYGSPVFFVNRAFPGSNIYTAEDFPEVDVLAITTFDDRVRHLPGKVFFEEILRGKLNARAIVVGDDHRFGYRGDTGSEELKRMCGEAGIALTVVPRVKLGDGSVISSSAIRAALERGDLQRAQEMLGRTPDAEMIRRCAGGQREAVQTL